MLLYSSEFGYFSFPSMFICSQTIRETWGNTSEFNYQMFERMHGGLKGKYMNVNDLHWQLYTTVNSSDVHKSPAEIRPNEFDFEIRRVFIVGEMVDNQTQNDLLEESKQYNDVIQESFVDSYNNLTLKTVMMLKWFNSHCQNKGKFAFW